MITREEYLQALSIVARYEEQQGIDDFDEWVDEEAERQSEPCSVCGEINGMVNPCCANYDPLHIHNCGYG